MKRFSLGFMKSISSSYEVELSDNDSDSTCDSISFNSYSTETGGVLKSRRSGSVMNSGSIDTTTDYTYYNGDVNESTSSNYEYDEQSTATEGRDEVAALPKKIESGYITQRTRSDLSTCSTVTAQSISTSVSRFLTAVDKTVDVVVDALIPLEQSEIKPSVDNTPSVTSNENKKKSLPKAAAFKKALSFTRVLSLSKRGKSKNIREEDEESSVGTTFSKLKKRRNKRQGEEEIAKENTNVSSRTSDRNLSATNGRTEKKSSKKKNRFSIKKRKENNVKEEKKDGDDNTSIISFLKRKDQMKTVEKPVDNDDDYFFSFFKPMAPPTDTQEDPGMDGYLSEDESYVKRKNNKKKMFKIRKRKSDRRQLLGRKYNGDVMNE
jgi:hypothetical protein